MNRVKRFFCITGWILLGLLVIGVLHFMWPRGRTVDFSGFVTEVRADPDSRDVYVIAESDVQDITMEIKISKWTRCILMSDRKATNARDIKPGDFITLNLRSEELIEPGQYKATAKSPVKVGKSAQE